jgi:outer membrane immunogenic protein
MKSLTSGVIALFALLPFAAAAHAAHLPLPTKAPPPPAPAANPFVTGGADWTGFYLGVNGGVANEDGVLIGGTLGYNFQTGPMVFGIEGDLDATWANIAEPTLGTLRGRIGYSFGQFMPYFTAGWADGDHGSSGSAIGGGVEFHIMPAVSLKAEYLHVRLSDPDDIFRLGLNWHFNPTGFGEPIATRY